VDFVGHCFVPRNANVAAWPFPEIEECGDCTLFIAEYNTCSGLGMFRMAKSHPLARIGLPTALSRRYNRTLHSYLKI
jgi:hypothetical protein